MISYKLRQIGVIFVTIIFGVNVLVSLSLLKIDNKLRLEMDILDRTLDYLQRPRSTDAGTITWAHAVNSQRHFLAAIASRMDFLEADIQIEPESGHPIMAHDPGIDSDLTLKKFLEDALGQRVGVKLDFKTDKAIMNSTDILGDFARRFEGRPLWMNADIVGHGNIKEGKVTASVFLGIVRNVTPQATISVGWNINCSHYLKETDPRKLKYDWDDMRRMREALLKVRGEADITFAVWSRFVLCSLKVIEKLTSEFPGSTVTIWGREGEADVDEVKTIYSVLPKSKVFLDLPDSDRKILLEYVRPMTGDLVNFHLDPNTSLWSYSEDNS